MRGWFLKYRFIGFTTVFYLMLKAIFKFLGAKADNYIFLAFALFSAMYDQHDLCKKMSLHMLHIVVTESRVKIVATNSSGHSQVHHFSVSKIAFISQITSHIEIHLTDGSRIHGIPDRVQLDCLLAKI